MNITKYNAICNLGANVDEVFEKALSGVSDAFIVENNRRVGKVFLELPEISDDDFNTRANRLALACIAPLEIEKYDKNSLAVVVACTNSGVNEYEESKNPKHYEIGNTAEFIKKYFGLNNFSTSVSTACSSGIKAFSIAEELLNSDFSKYVLVIGVDALSKVPLYGFDSLEILSPNPTNPFSEKRCGINIGEGAAAFILEKSYAGIEALGIGETTDSYHLTTPDPEGIEAEKAIRQALGEIKTVDYINLHGTGTLANDLMEARAINRVFGSNVPSSSTKPLTGHCLGAAASIEIALCAKLLEYARAGGERVFPHIYDGNYDGALPKIALCDTNTRVKNLKTCLCTSFGFGGTNCAIILGRGKKDE